MDFAADGDDWDDFSQRRKEKGGASLPFYHIIGTLDK
jgi:hypothetical protein